MKAEQPKDRVFLYDTTLRDGAQGRGISFSLNDKIRIASLLSEFGVSWVEGGWPGSNPKDAEFFKSVKKLNLGSTKVTAFGSTRKKGIKARDDQNLKALLAAETPTVALVGKSWTLHVEKVLETSLEENLDMIRDSVSFMKQEGREVVFDAEHFFDAYRADSAYALSVLRAALDAGADWLALCDTNGGTLPDFIEKAVQEVKATVVAGRAVGLGIHAHNDSDLAVANSLAAVRAGCCQVQGTINGYGERCGNANLISVAANLELKMGMHAVGETNLKRLSEVSHKVSEVANTNPDMKAPFVGVNAFAHKGGIHVAAVEKISQSYEHINPEKVGNKREILVSELSGRGNIRMRAAELGLASTGIEAKVLEEVKGLESRGFQFENAEGSFELLLHRAKEGYKKPFDVLDAMVVSTRGKNRDPEVQAVVKVEVNNEVMHTAATGNGPVNALDSAMRKALEPHFPDIRKVHLSDYKVRILDPESATAAMTRVIIEASCNGESWCTVGCSENLIEASFHALADSMEYYLYKFGGERAGKVG